MVACTAGRCEAMNSVPGTAYTPHRSNLYFLNIYPSVGKKKKKDFKLYTRCLSLHLSENNLDLKNAENSVRQTPHPSYWKKKKVNRPDKVLFR